MCIAHAQSMPKPPRSNVTFTALIWLGMILTVVGVVVALLGIGGTINLSAKIGDYELQTTSLGVAIMALGAIMAAFVAVKLPKGVVPFAVERRTLLDRIAAQSGWVIILAIVAVVLFILSLLFR
jgi:hypothetical protein